VLLVKTAVWPNVIGELLLKPACGGTEALEVGIPRLLAKPKNPSFVVRHFHSWLCAPVHVVSS
jgi:hypothetical protein